jgi:hypothetical protein
MLRVLPLLAVAALTASAVAEEPDGGAPRAAVEARVAESHALVAALGTDDPRARAWAAYDAGRWRVVDAHDALTAVARVAPDAQSKEQRAAHRAVLDALVLLERPVPREVVDAAIAAGETYQGLILAARDVPTHTGALLALSEGKVEDSVWLACCELLAPRRLPRMATRLLGDLTLRLELEVSDHTHRGGGGSRSSLTIGDGAVRLPDGFPPAGIYRLDIGDDAKPGAVLLARGYRPVSWQRLELANGAGFGGHHSQVDRAAARIALLSEMTRTWYTGSLQPTTSAFLVVDDGERPYADQAREAYERLLTERDRFAQGLVDDGLVDAGTPRPRIVVAVHDWRNQPAEPLPKLPYDVEPTDEPKPTP